jgi:hypothetical protein
MCPMCMANAASVAFGLTSIIDIWGSVADHWQACAAWLAERFGDELTQKGVA